jgi:hypothetical protein
LISLATALKGSRATKSLNGWTATSVDTHAGVCFAPRASSTRLVVKPRKKPGARHRHAQIMTTHISEARFAPRFSKLKQDKSLSASFGTLAVRTGSGKMAGWTRTRIFAIGMALPAGMMWRWSLLFSEVKIWTERHRRNSSRYFGLKTLLLYSTQSTFSFTGIEKATTLKILQLDATGLKSLNGIGNCPSLVDLDVRFNQLSGPLSNEIACLSNLETFFCGDMASLVATPFSVPRARIHLSGVVGFPTLGLWVAL